jgi:hypothetical protein
MRDVLIGVGGALLGAVVGVRGALAISRDERRHRKPEDLRSALAIYLGALYPAVNELRELPPARTLPGFVTLIDRLQPPDVAWARQRSREYRLYGYRHKEGGDRLAAAFAQLQVRAMPEELRVAVDRANDYVKRLGEQRTPDLIEEWSSVHADLMRGREALDSGTPPRARRPSRRG